ncbi:DEAD/DEAH box helicase [Haloechinothrix alba]|uniref:DEAD/DEAH box helicase n=1 Tax=Haloechinothrix alba TaxID=664784 RepID=A0A238YVI5_9PSEU|nr:DEAD/DEAH box helicase [Haloechinothrix alba]SNR74654.1 DEAD/DEAH box helicase [Haloechinothrix alba]
MSSDGEQWPDPYLSLNPNFAPGDTVDELVNERLLHPECERIFRIKRAPADPGMEGLHLYRHQREAIETASTGQSYVLTTGTGSGKSLAYPILIVDRVLRGRDSGGARKGIKATVVYPMNALANSQRRHIVDAGAQRRASQLYGA